MSTAVAAPTALDSIEKASQASADELAREASVPPRAWRGDSFRGQRVMSMTAQVRC
jgi:hypothetical protein